MTRKRVALVIAILAAITLVAFLASANGMGTRLPDEPSVTAYVPGGAPAADGIGVLGHESFQVGTTTYAWEVVGRYPHGGLRWEYYVNLYRTVDGDARALPTTARLDARPYFDEEGTYREPYSNRPDQFTVAVDVQYEQKPRANFTGTATLELDTWTEKAWGGKRGPPMTMAMPFKIPV